MRNPTRVHRTVACCCSAAWPPHGRPFNQSRLGLFRLGTKKPYCAAMLCPQRPSRSRHHTGRASASYSALGAESAHRGLDDDMWGWIDDDKDARASSAFTSAGFIGSPMAQTLVLWIGVVAFLGASVFMIVHGGPSLGRMAVQYFGLWASAACTH